MHELRPEAERVAALLIARKQTVAVSESSTGGLVSAALLAVPGASAFFQGGAVVYTAKARSVLLGIADTDMHGIRSASEPYARLAAERVRARFGTDWGLAETGAAGPSGNRYGDAAGHCCLAVAGPGGRVLTIETASADRAANMVRFGEALLSLFAAVLTDQPAA